MGVPFFETAWPVKGGFLADGRFRVDSEIRFRDSRGKLYVVPTGSLVDGSSYPWWTWTLLRRHPYDATCLRAACIHDVCGYQRAGLPDAIDRADLDRVYGEASWADGLPVVESKIFSTVLRATGWWAWWGHYRENKRSLKGDTGKRN